MSVSDVLALEQDGPSQWNAQKDYDAWPTAREPEHVFLHWGGSPVRDTAAEGNVLGERAQLRAWEDYHVHTRGWKGLAYDWAIGNSGRLYRIRGSSRSAATSGDVDQDGISNNAEGDAVVMLVGSGQQASSEALEMLKAVLDAFGKPVYGHKEAKGTATACPGPQLMSWLGGYRDGTVEDVPTPVGGNEPNESKPEKKPKKKPKEDVLSKLKLWRKGERGPQVKVIQDLLSLYGSPVNIDGIYGPLTERAVREVQFKLGASVDGIVGPETWGKLLRAD